MEFYAIQHIPSGDFLPTHDGTTTRGYTGDEPTSGKYIPPRLFQNEGAAKRALTWWLKGETRVRRVGGGIWDEYDETWHLHERPERKAEDMRIVKVKLRVCV